MQTLRLGVGAANKESTKAMSRVQTLRLEQSKTGS